MFADLDVSDEVPGRPRSADADALHVPRSSRPTTAEERCLAATVFGSTRPPAVNATITSVAAFIGKDGQRH